MTDVQLDLNNPVFQGQSFLLQKPGQRAILNMLKNLAQTTWNPLDADHGLHWERILSEEDLPKKALYSIRLVKSFVPWYITIIRGCLFSHYIPITIRPITKVESPPIRRVIIPILPPTVKMGSSRTWTT